MPILQTILSVAVLILIVVMLFNIIIFVHELGHFLAGKWRGLHIDKFQIWFGKPIWKKEINGVQYGLGWIPAGGFVALPQMAPMDAIEGGMSDRKALPKITPMDKIIVAIAGPLFSILLALGAAVIVWAVGKPKDFYPTTTIGYVETGSPGDKAGILPGDKILEINGKKVNGFAGTLESISESIVLSSGDQIEFLVERPGADEPVKLQSGFDRPDTKWFQRSGLRNVGLAPMGDAIVGKVVENGPAIKAGLEEGDQVMSVDGQPLFSPSQLSQYLKKVGEKEVVIGIKKPSGEMVETKIAAEVPASPEGMSPKIGILWSQTSDVDMRIVHPNPFTQVWDSLTMMWVTVSKVADPGSDIGVDHLSGPVGIGKLMFSFMQMEDGWRRVLGFMVLFNVNLAVLNMLPFPVLDGGHITLAILEKIAGRPVQTKALEVIQTACALALISLMLYVTSKDIGDGFGRGGGGSSGEIKFAPE
ncbi:MAG: RIP metalloprotease RseP [Luteolibacter sp.]